MCASYSGVTTYHNASSICFLGLHVPCIGKTNAFLFRNKIMEIFYYCKHVVVSAVLTTNFRKALRIIRRTISIHTMLGCPQGLWRAETHRGCPVEYGEEERGTSGAPIPQRQTRANGPWRCLRLACFTLQLYKEHIHAASFPCAWPLSPPCCRRDWCWRCWGRCALGEIGARGGYGEENWRR
jgi:hypothetical protein